MTPSSWGHGNDSWKSIGKHSSAHWAHSKYFRNGTCSCCCMQLSLNSSGFGHPHSQMLVESCWAQWAEVPIKSGLLSLLEIHSHLPAPSFNAGGPELQPRGPTERWIVPPSSSGPLCTESQVTSRNLGPHEWTQAKSRKDQEHWQDAAAWEGGMFILKQIYSIFHDIFLDFSVICQFFH